MIDFDKIEALSSAHPCADQTHFVTWMRANNGGKYSAEAKSDTELELNILGPIGSSFWYEGVSAKWVKQQLDAHPKLTQIRVLVDSPGGSVFDGIAIANLLKRHAATVIVEVVGEAASAASVISVGAADKLLIHEGAMLMIHRASVMAWGFSTELRQAADMLDEITSSIIDMYETRTGLARAEIEKMVNAETWLKAKASVDLGFADEVVAGKKKAAPASNAAPRPANDGLSLFAQIAKENVAAAHGAVARFADRPPAQVRKYVPHAGQDFSELAWHAAKALGRETPLTEGARARALRDFDAMPIVDAHHAERARALAKSLTEAGWFS